MSNSHPSADFQADQPLLDPTDFPSSDGQSSRNMECLRILMLRMMHATDESVKNLPAESCSAEAVSFMAATAWASPCVLSDVGL